MVARVRTVLSWVCCLASLSSCGFEPACRNEILKKSLSPNGKLVALVFSRNCGATTGSNFQISVADKFDIPDDVGNVLIADRTPIYSNEFDPAWDSEDHLTVFIPKNSRIFFQDSYVSGTYIKFKYK